MSKLPTDAQTPTFQYRPGVAGFPGWQGIYTECDPGSNPVGTLRKAINVRAFGPALVSRFGWVEMGTVPAAAKTYLATNHNTQNPPRRLWSVENSCYGVGSGVGSLVRTYDKSIGLQLYGAFSDASYISAALGTYGGRYYIGAKHRLFRSAPYVDFNGKFVSSTVNAATEPLFEWAGYTIKWLQEYNGLLFIGLANDTVPANSQIVAYDGITFLQDLGTIDAPLNACLWRDKLAVGFGTTVGSFRHRDAAGTWTTVVSAGLGVSAVSGNSMADLRGDLYFASGGQEIFKYDGAVVTTARTVAAASVAPNGVLALAVWMGRLWYLWNQLVTAVQRPRLGAMEPDYATPWTDSYKTLNSDVSTLQIGSSMAVLGDQLYIGAYNNSIARCPEKYPKGTWTSLQYTAASTAQLVALKVL
jgi:hypothetical protein